MLCFTLSFYNLYFILVTKSQLNIYLCMFSFISDFKKSVLPRTLGNDKKIKIKIN